MPFWLRPKGAPGHTRYCPPECWSGARHRQIVSVLHHDSCDGLFRSRPTDPRCSTVMEARARWNTLTLHECCLSLSAVADMQSALSTTEWLVMPLAKGRMLRCNCCGEKGRCRHHRSFCTDRRRREWALWLCAKCSTLTSGRRWLPETDSYGGRAPQFFSGYQGGRPFTNRRRH
jgi:hypothetical protein